MKKRKKQTKVQKLERRFKRKTLSLLKEISNLSKENSHLREKYGDLLKGFDRMKDGREEQERIINMFKSCIDRSVLEKVLRDEYVVFLKAMYPGISGVAPMFGSQNLETPSFKYEGTK